MVTKSEESIREYAMNTHRLKRALLRPESLLVCYALVEIVWTLLRSQWEWDELVRNNPPDASLPSIESPVRVYADMYLLLVASVGLWTRKSWGYLIASLASAWLLYRGFMKWRTIVSSVDPVWSSSILKYWWKYANGQWDLPRIALAAFIMLCAAISLIRYWRRSLPF
jgi:hypothetical protein